MAAEWHYSKEGKQHGPVSASVLKNLAKTGNLLPTDLIWKEGMAEWKPAKNLKGLFLTTPVSAIESPKASLASPNVPVLPVVPETAQKQTLVESARGAAQYAAKQTERTKLINLTLPPLYQALGRHAFSSPDFRAEFAELFQQLDQVQAELSEISGRSPAVAKSLGDKAKAMAGQAMQAAQSQKLSMRQSSLFGTLGKAMFDKHEAASGPQELVKPIADCVARLAMLDTELDALSASKDGTWITPKRLAIAAVAGLFIVVACIYFAFPSSTRLTEDYCPLIPGRERKFVVQGYVFHTKELADGTVLTGRFDGAQRKEQRRLDNGYVIWESIPFVKLGAKVGDTWESASPHKNEKFTFQYEKAISLKGKTCAIVVQNSRVADGDPHSKMTYWLVKGIGLVHREEQRINKGKWGPVDQLSYEEWE